MLLFHENKFLTTLAQFQTLIEDIAVVLYDADKDGLLKKELVPSGFHENNPNQIVVAYNEFMESNAKPTLMSVADKAKKNKYTTPYELYHDIKLVAAHEIVQYDVGTDKYIDVDFFYKFSTEILLREVGSLGLRLQANELDEDTLGIFRDDFEKISKNYTVANGEVITHMHKYEEPIAPTFHGLYGAQQPIQTKTITQPLFSSLVGKSSIDLRNSVVPDPYQLAKVVGSGVASSTNSNSFKSFSKATARIPPPSLGPAQVLDSFFHPNWYTIEAPKWLKYKEHTLKPPVDSTLVKNADSDDLRAFEKQCQTMSFAPTYDLRNSVLSEDLKTSVWLNHIGLKQIDQIKEAYLQKQGKEITPPKEKADVVVEEATAPAEEGGTTDVTADFTPATTNEINLENLALFNPEAFFLLQELKREQSELTKSPRDLQKNISTLLLQLNKLRQQRFLQNNSTDPTSAEVVVYKKIMRLMTLLIKSAEGQQVSLPLSKKLPVLLNEYRGVLPGPLPTRSISSTKANRLTGIRGPYKKKGRFA